MSPKNEVDFFISVSEKAKRSEYIDYRTRRVVSKNAKLGTVFRGIIEKKLDANISVPMGFGIKNAESRTELKFQNWSTYIGHP